MSLRREPLYRDLILGPEPAGPLAPLGYWRLDEPDGEWVVRNLGRAGARLNGMHTPGKRGGASLLARDPHSSASFFDDAYVSGTGMDTTGVGSTNALNSDWSIEAWFLRRSAVKWSGVFTNNNPGTGAPLMTFVEFSNRVGLNGCGLTATSVSVDLGPDRFNKVIYAVVTKTGGNEQGTANLTVYAFLDGRCLPAAKGTNLTWAFSPQDGFAIGRHAMAKHYFDGLIADVAVYDRALPLEEVLRHYECGSGSGAA